MDSMDERKIWKHWAYLKNELYIDDLLESMVEAGVFVPSQKRDILNAQPNTRQMKTEKFLNALIKAGDKGFETFCNIMRRDGENRYRPIMERLEISEHPGRAHSAQSTAASAVDARADNARPPQRPISGMSSSSGSTDVSSQSLPSRDGETGERNNRRRKAWRSESSASESIPESASHYRHTPSMPRTGEPYLAPMSGGATSQAPRMNIQTKMTAQPAASSSASAAAGSDKNDPESAVDMKALEQELVLIAPTIAELFQKFAKTNIKEPISEEEIQNVKAENERLRKTNRALIDKLNSFQQRIISLQVENKKLREEGEGVKEARDELDKKEFELKDLQKRLEEQKIALEEKELELNNQLLKIKDIEEDIQRQKEQIVKLETLHEEGQIQSGRQQERIMTLQEDKRKQQQQILKLEFKQRLGEERLQSLDDRMRHLEQPRRTIRRTPQTKPKRMGMFYN